MRDQPERWSEEAVAHTVILQQQRHPIGYSLVFSAG